MNSNVIDLTKNAAIFWFEAHKYFECISFLAEAITNQLSKDGYQVDYQSYSLKFAANDNGESRIVYDRLKNHWWGTFSINDSQSKNLQFGFGITFGANDPSNNVEPWIPLLYFYTGKIIDSSGWNYWEYSRHLFTPNNLLYNATGNHIVTIPLDEFDNIESLEVLRFPLGGINNTDDISKIVRPSVEALRYKNEDLLSDIQDYLFSDLNEWWS